MIRRALLAVVVAALLSGCTQGKPHSVDASLEAEAVPMIEGWVLDASQAAVSAASLRIEAANVTALSAPDGYYSFADLPTDEPLLIVAEAEGYKPLSKSVTLVPETSLLLNFTLELVPVKVPYFEMVPHKGLLACQVAVVAAGNEEHAECGGDDPNNKPIIDFPLGPDTAGVVIELAWEPGSPLAEHMRLVVETVGFGDQDQVLAEVVGTSVLRAQINHANAMRYYSAGGIARAIVEAGTNPDEEESTVGASLHLQQAFDLYVTVFYVEGPSPTYTALK